MNLETIMLSERSQTQKVTHCMILFTWNTQKRQIHRDRKQISGCQGLAEGEWGVLLNGYRVFFLDDEKVLKLQRGGSCTAFWMHWMPLNGYIFKWLTLEYYSTFKKKEFLSRATTWLNLEDVMLSKISQSQKNKYCMILLIGGI